ncbi:hypothetical protein FQ775_01135 [Nitratireductor mangrovi]|uniref:Uncharacterized protein n=1 Tax=Nitratireductor mangrovi TaxID=2599600 RepID=A0A5B8KTZ7_9HYPH|nr:hypothetical protein [Nitratireductor mangrovi]QDY99085.1 hypothetical protein FQ775_01135 [Nitratireductor mangrovi]
MSYELSDSLRELASDLSEFASGGVVLDGPNVEKLMQRIRHFGDLALALEHRVSRNIWNGLAATEREERERETAAILAAVAEPGSNVTLLPGLERPFSDGRPETLS